MGIIRATSSFLPKFGSTIHSGTAYKSLRTLAFKEKNYQVQDSYQYVLPRNMGFIQHLTHDRQEDESQTAYLMRCYGYLLDLIDTNQNSFIFFASSTVFKSPNLNKDLVGTVEKRFLNAENIFRDDISITPGHIAVYTKEGKFVSHQPGIDHSKSIDISQDRVIYNDIEKSIKENQKSSTYLVVLSKSCFPNVSLDNLGIIRPYHWAALGNTGDENERDNCATGLQKVFTGVKIRELMNPTATLNFLLERAGNNRMLVDIEKNELKKTLATSGIIRTLFHIAESEQQNECELVNVSRSSFRPK